MRILTALPENERRMLSRFALVFALTIITWATLHDWHLISVEPRHFTEYHRPLLPLTHHGLLAFQYALVATLGPGLAYGAVTYAAARAGTWPKLSLRFALGCFLPVLVLIESACLMVGEVARVQHAVGAPLPYPDWLYPDSTAGIAYSQSVNITAYLGAVVFGVGCQCGLLVARRRLALRLAGAGDAGAEPASGLSPT